MLHAAGTSKNGIHVTAQAVDESSNTLWRIEHWTDHFYSHVPTKHTFLVSYNLDELLEPSTPSHFQFHSCYQSLLNLVFDAFKPCHYIQPSGVYQVDMFSMHMDITCLLVIPDGSILSLSEWGSIFQIQPLDKIERVFEFKQGAFIPIKKTTLTFSPTKPNAPLRALHWPVQAITSFWTIYQSAMVYHDSGLILVPTSNCRTLERFDVNTKLWKSIRYLYLHSLPLQVLRPYSFCTALSIHRHLFAIQLSRVWCSCRMDAWWSAPLAALYFWRRCQILRTNVGWVPESLPLPSRSQPRLVFVVIPFAFLHTTTKFTPFLLKTSLATSSLTQS